VPPPWMRPVSLWWAGFRRDRVFERVFTYFPSSSQHFRCCGRTCPYPEPRRQQLNPAHQVVGQGKQQCHPFDLVEAPHRQALQATVAGLSTSLDYLFEHRHPLALVAPRGGHIGPDR